jgi:hypothetical protein
VVDSPVALSSGRSVFDDEIEVGTAFDGFLKTTMMGVREVDVSSSVSCVVCSGSFLDVTLVARDSEARVLGNRYWQVISEDARG